MICEADECNKNDVIDKPERDSSSLEFATKLLYTTPSAGFVRLCPSQRLVFSNAVYICSYAHRKPVVIVVVSVIIVIVLIIVVAIVIFIVLFYCHRHCLIECRCHLGGAVVVL